MKKGMYELMGWQRPTGEIFAPIPSSNYHTELPGQMLASIGYFGFWNYYLNTGRIEGAVRKKSDGLFHTQQRVL